MDNSSMNKWLGFSLLPHQEIQISQEHHNSQSSHGAAGGLIGNFIHSSCEEVVVSAGGTSTDDDISAAGESCFDSSTLPSLNLPPAAAAPPFSLLHHPSPFNNHSQGWNNMNNYKSKSEISSTVIMGNQEPKLENFLGVGCVGGTSLFNQHQHNGGGGGGGGGNNNNTSIGLSMIKSWLRNNPTPPPENNRSESSSIPDEGIVGNFVSNAQNLSLSMSSGGGGGDSLSALPLLMAAPSTSDGGGESSSTSETNKHQQTTTTTPPHNMQGVHDHSESGAVIETVPTRKSVDTFGQRTSIYRGVTRHRWTGRYEAHLWDNSCRREGQTRKGRQVYLGGYDKEEKAARAYDLAALKYWGPTTTTNFPTSNYEKELEEMKHMTRQEYVASLRRKSSGFSRGASIYRGVTRHHQHGRWQARIGRVAGNKDLYLGTFSTQEEAAEAYDIAAIKFRGLNAVTNFEISRYDVKSILESSTLPIGAAAKRLKDAEHAAEMALDAQIRANDDNLSSHLTDGISTYAPSGHHGWPSSLTFHQTLGIHYPYNTHNPPQQRIWCKQEHDSEVTHSSFPDLHHQIQMGNTHNFLQPSVLHNLMSLDSASLEHSSASNSVIYGGNGGSGSGQALGYGGAGGFVLPMSSTVIAADDQEGNQNQNGYENMFGSSQHDPYNQTRNLMYYHDNSEQSSTVKITGGGGIYDQGSSCNNWVPTGVPNLGVRATSSVAVCHGAAPTFTVWNDT